MAKLVSKTYGEALFQLAIENNQLEEINDEIMVLLDTFKINQEIITILNHPKITKEEKVNITQNIFKGRLTDITLGFLIVIVTNNRFQDIEGICQYYIDKVKEYKRIGLASITTATELTKKEKETIEKKLLKTTNYKQFEMEYRVDKHILGGIIIKIGDKVLDNSIKNQLNKLTKNLYEIKLANE